MKRLSSLNMLQHCPGYARIQREHGSAETEATRRGREVHAAIAAYVDDMTPCAHERLVDRVLDLAAACDANSLRTEVEVELHGHLGHVDLLVLHSTWAAVVDWKTGREQSSPPIEDDLQMLAYAVAVTRAHELTDLVVYRVHVDTGGLYSLELDAAGLAAAEARLRPLLDEPHEKTKLGAHCDRCLCRQMCPDYRANADSVREGLLALDEPALAIADDAAAVRFKLALPRLERLLEDGKKALRSYLEARGGSVTADGTTAYLSRSTRRSIALTYDQAAGVLGETCARERARVTALEGLTDDEVSALVTADLVKSYEVVQVRLKKGDSRA